MAEATGDGDLADSFRRRYHSFQQSIQTALTAEFGDSVVLERLGDDLANFTAAVQMVSQLSAICNACKLIRCLSTVAFWMQMRGAH